MAANPKGEGGSEGRRGGRKPLFPKHTGLELKKGGEGGKDDSWENVRGTGMKGISFQNRK